MKSSLRAGLVIFGLVVLGGLASAGVFVVFGSQLAVYALVGLVPTLVVVGGLWVRQSVTTAGTNQAQYTRRRAHEVGASFVEAWETREQMRSAYPDVAGDGFGLNVDALVADLERAGIQFDRDSGSFTLRSVGNLEEVNALGERVTEFETDLESAFVEAVDQRVEEIDSELDRLADLVGDDAVGIDAEVAEDAEWTDAGEALEDARADATAAIDAAAEAIQEAISTADDVDREAVEATLSDAREHAAEDDVTAAVTALLDARDAVRREGETSFDDARQRLRSLLDTVAAADVDQYLTDGTTADVSDIQRAVAELDDAMELAALTEHREAARDRCVDVVATLEAELDRLVDRLEGADVPEGFYAVPAAHDERYADDLRATDDLAAMESAWEEAVDDLTAAIDDLRPKSDVVRGYDQVREVIESELKASGRVDADDLPVREHEVHFLGLYYRENPDAVSFDVDEPSLTVAGEADDYAVAVTVQFERGGPDRDVTVTLENDTYEATRTITTPLVGTAEFDEIPRGEYTVRAVPGDDDFGPAERSITVDGDTDVDLDLVEVTLRDRLCDGLEDGAEQYLDELEDRFADRLETEGYLDTEMSYPIEEQYVPCLLALWAERAGHSLTGRDDGAVLVYDGETIREELTNVVTYNLDAGDSIAFAELREKFLSAPVPDDELDALATGAEFDDVAVSDATLTKS